MEYSVTKKRNRIYLSEDYNGFHVFYDWDCNGDSVMFTFKYPHLNENFKYPFLYDFLIDIDTIPKLGARTIFQDLPKEIPF
jgi:hypothetical protein